MPKTIHPLRAYRAARNLSCAQVGRMLGLAETTVRSYENANRRIDAETAVEIERVLGIPREELLPAIFRRVA